jgi:SAM-dependent methyltransferase
MGDKVTSFFYGKVAPFARPRGKEAFLKGLRPGDRVLDVGCGNNSPARAKLCASAVHYTGLDIGDYNQRVESIRSADAYIVTSRADFASTIEASVDSFDAVVSSHNLEHCDEPERVLSAMCAALKKGGRLYLSFPSEASVTFPRRKKDTLNFFDDTTHTRPPELMQVLSIVRNGGLRVEFMTARHRPFIPMLVGLMLEPISYLTQRAMPLGTTWALYGFETVIWAVRT